MNEDDPKFSELSKEDQEAIILAKIEAIEAGHVCAGDCQTPSMCLFYERCIASFPLTDDEKQGFWP